jgi:rubrerythrin
MNIFKFAMQMEKDGEAFYRNLSGKVGNIGLKTILNMIADDEVKHYKIFEALFKNTKPSLAETKILKNSKNIFSQMKGENIESNIEQIDLYKKAQGIERMSEEFYREKAGEVKNPAQKKLLLKIADEEKRHFFLLENIILFVSRPKTWLENAEFVHLEEY